MFVVVGRREMVQFDFLFPLNCPDSDCNTQMKTYIYIYILRVGRERESEREREMRERG